MESEFRQDLVSGDWVVISPKRFKRPEQFKKKGKRKIVPKKDCPFEDPQKNGNSEPIFIFDKNGKKSVNLSQDWQIQLIENKYPIVSHKESICAVEEKHGPFLVSDGIGHHDVLITRDHFKNFANLDKKMANMVFSGFKERYLEISENKYECTKYVFIFHNWGPKAGASVFHPHYQMLSLPIISPDVSRSLTGSAKYFKENKKCVHCAMIEYEKKEKKRIVFENKDAIVFAPFVAKEPFELRIFPKKHQAYFERTPKKIMESVVDALQKSLQKIEKKLGDPDYNFFIHTAPIDNNGKYHHYHWHVEVLPRFSDSAGVELGIGVEVTVVDPEMAARILK